MTQELIIGQATIQRVTTIDTKGGGYAILLTTTNAIGDDVLVALMRGRGSVMKVTMERLQQSLLEGDDPNEGMPPTTERVWETTSGDVVKAHAYQSMSGDERCDLCGYSTSHEAHSQTEKLKGKLLDEATQDVTPEQEEARAALASRSRSSRNGPAGA